jgi:predicted extracellular nuclease
VVGKVVSGDTLDVMVVHYPSRRGGKAKSEPYRLLVAEILKHAVDSVMQVRQNPNVVIMGDFNDGPSSPVMKKLCSDGRLVNLMQGKKEGTYRYRGAWEILDQFLVSENVRTKNAEVLQHPFLLEEDEKYGGNKPFRTYNGMRYQGGFSDHLPIILDLQFLIHDDKDYYSE